MFALIRNSRAIQPGYSLRSERQEGEYDDNSAMSG
jgi:hypothetical protein